MSSSLPPIDEEMPLAAENGAVDHPVPVGGNPHASPVRRRMAAWQDGTPSRPPRLVETDDGHEYVVRPMSRDARESNDVVHQSIKICPAVQVILDSPSVQRLIDLRQLGLSFNAYPNCTHTRKEHSLGVMEIAGNMARHFQQKQPQLNVTEKDVLCLRMAGLCHDLGHGPFSHAFEVFLKEAYKDEREHPERYEERNRLFKEECGVEMPPIPEDYEHEKTSLMMIDFALASVGLEIDWDNLDGPLKQVGHGIDAEKFGVSRGNGEVDHFTSKDWIFIKECILGRPLEQPDAPEDQTDFVGREHSKEFLYDIVNNRHNGLDVDKIDYFDRDGMQAYGSSHGNLNIFLRDACVAWATCPRPNKCFQCKGEAECKHLMICYPKKHVSSAMNFFATRMKNHETVYTHKKTKSAELKMVDTLKEADKHFCMLLSTQRADSCGFPLPSRFQDFSYAKLPISRSWMYPRLFLRMTDTIVDKIEERAIDHSPSPQLDRLRKLLNDRRQHKVYKRAGEVEIGAVGGEEFWELSPDDMKKELIWVLKKSTGKDDDTQASLGPDDFIVEKRTLHYGRKSQNPVSQMRFLDSKEDQAKLGNPIDDLPTAKEITTLPMNTPQNFLRQTIRVFCVNDEKHDLLARTFAGWEVNKREDCKMKNSFGGLKTFAMTSYQDDDDHNQSESQSLSEKPFCTQDDAAEEEDSDDDAFGASSKRKSSGRESPRPAKKKLSW